MRELTGETMSQHRERYDRSQTKRLSGVAFLFGFSDSFLIYILSAYFSESIGSANVSVFYFVAFSAILVILFRLHRIILKIGGRALFLIFLFGVVLLQIPLVFLPVSIVGSFLIMSYFVVTALAWVTLDMLLEQCSEDRHSGRIRGMNLSAMNLGILFAPFLSTVVLARFGFTGVFFLSIVFYSILLLLALVFVRPIRIFDQPSATLSGGIFRKIRSRSDIVKIYAISFALNFFYAAMIVYTSLRLRELGMSWETIGVVFSIMLLPFIFLQYPLGSLADRRLGEKELMVGALFLAAVSTASLAWIRNADIIVWAVALFITRVGISGIEILSDSYFYKRIDGGDGDLIAFFRTARPLGNIVAALLLGAWLLIFPLSSVFILPACVLFLAIFFSLRLSDNPSETEVRLIRVNSNL